MGFKSKLPGVYICNAQDYIDLLQVLGCSHAAKVSLVL